MTDGGLRGVHLLQQAPVRCDRLDVSETEFKLSTHFSCSKGCTPTPAILNSASGVTRTHGAATCWPDGADNNETGAAPPLPYNPALY